MPTVRFGTDPVSRYEQAGGAEEAARTVAAKAALADGSAQSDEGGVQQEAPILGKFKSQEDLARAYQELERKLGARAAAEETEEELEDEGDEPDADGDEDIGDEVEEEAEAQGDGAPALSDEQVAAIERAVHEAAGGAQAFQRLQAWAAQNGDPVLVRTYSQALNQGNAALAATALKALRYDQMQAVGYEPELVTGRPTRTSVRPFGSQKEAMLAIRDPRYEYDAEYQAEIDARLQKSPGLIEVGYN